MRKDTLRRDLREARFWIERNTPCAIQRREGWYVKDCIQTGARSKCERCKVLHRLDRQIAAV